MKNWFASINWLKLKLQLNMFIIQTNRCFIKSKIRDLLCIRRLFIEIFNDYRISLINDLFVIFTVFETRVYEILLIISFDAYIEICSLESRHQCRAIAFSFLIWIVASRLFDSDLNRYTMFETLKIRIWKHRRIRRNLHRSQKFENFHDKQKIYFSLNTLNRNFDRLQHQNSISIRN